MASYSRTTGHYNSEDSDDESYLSNEYSTTFSNKLIDLAISVDADDLAVRKCSKRSSTTGMEGEDMKNANFGNYSYADRFKDQNHGPFLNGLGSTLTINGHSHYRETKRDVWTNSSGLEKLQYSKKVPICSTSGNLSNHLRPTGCNLLTVFSSPCTEFFPHSRKSNRIDSDYEVPEYVRIMMEKDLALKRLVKTGSVTISQVKPEIRTDNEKYLDDEDFFYDDADDESSVNEDSTRPYAPLAKIEDWEDFPCAKLLLELTHISLTSSSGSTPRRTEQSNGLSKIKVPLLPPSVIMTKVKKLPVPILQAKSSVRKGASSKSLISTKPKPNLPKHVTKPQQHSILLKQASKSPHYSSLPLPIKASTRKSKKSRLLSRTIVGENKNNVTAARPTRKSQASRNLIRESKAFTDDSFSGRNVFRESESFTEDPFSAFQVDPMTFLEVSLQEGKVPDDSLRRKYKCEFCEKKFCWSTDLKRHTLIHTGERPFKCPECPANFTRKFLMQKHLKKVHQSTVVTTSDVVPEEEDFNRVATLIDDATFLRHPRNGSHKNVDELYIASVSDFEFKTEFKEDVPDEDEDSYEDFEIQGGDGSGDEDEIELSTKFQVSDFGQQSTAKVTYLDF